MLRDRVRNVVAGTICSLAIAAAALGATPQPAVADDFSFHITYRGYLTGLRVGSGDLFGSFDGSSYRLDSAGSVSGIARLFSRYEGTAAARGSFADGATSYRAQVTGDGKESSVRLRLSGENVRRVNLNPEPTPHELEHPNLVPLTDTHRRNVLDPLRAAVTPGGFSGNRFDRSACERVLPVFTGRERIDIALSFREVRTVTAANRHGYSGPVMVCDAAYRPVAGHRDNQSGVAYVRDTARIELILAPVPGSDLLVPYRVTVTTPLGPAVLQARNFHVSGKYNSRLAQAQ